MMSPKIVLQKVGRLEGWAISTSELEPLRQRLRRENYAVKLLFFYRILKVISDPSSDYLVLVK